MSSPGKEAAPQAAKPNGAAEDIRNYAYARIDFEEVKRLYPLPEYCESRGIHLKRQGGLWIGRCPLHIEDTPSFVVYLKENDPHVHCYGCNFHGDIVDLEQAFGGGSNSDAVARLGKIPVTYLLVPTRTIAKPARKQFHPELVRPGSDDLKDISIRRSINVECLQIAVERGFLWVSQLKSHACWVLTDQARKTYLARRLDGGVWEQLDSKPKAWLLPGSSAKWPIGIEESAPYPAIALCEGGPDFLSAFAHAWAGWGRGQGCAGLYVICQCQNGLGRSATLLRRETSSNLCPRRRCRL